jgi:hypothetical protein
VALTELSFSVMDDHVTTLVLGYIFSGIDRLPLRVVV